MSDQEQQPQGDAEAEALWKELAATEKVEEPPQGQEPGGEPAQDWTVEEPADPQDDPAGEQQEQPPADDRWQAVPEELRQEYEATRAERDRYQQRIRSEAGRVAAYQRRYEELLRQAAPAQNEGRQSPLEVIDTALQQDYPELAEPLKKALQPLEDRLNEQDEGRRVAAQAELSDFIAAQEATVEQTHPGWTDFLAQNGAAFDAWVNHPDQSRRIHEAAHRNAQNIVDAAEAAEVLDLFKEYLGAAAPEEPGPEPQTPPLNDRRARQLSATATPQRPGRRPAISGIPEEGDPQAIWDAFAARDRQKSRA